MPIDRKKYEPITGNPRRKTRTEEGPGVAAGEEERSDSTGPDGPHTGTGRAPEAPDGAHTGTGAHVTPQGRTRRVKVTPRDWSELEAVADRLGGLPYAKVYNVAFEALREKLGRS